MIALVRIALSRPYTFVVLALLLLIVGPLAALRTPTDIFPDIRIPVIGVVWQYTGLPPDQMAGRITTPFQRALTTTVNDIEHIVANSYNGIGIVKIFFQPNVDIRTANAQVTAISQTLIKQLPPGATPPLILNYSASTVPIIQVALSGEGLTEQNLADIGINQLRTPLVTVPGAAIPYPFGGKQRQVQIDLNPSALQSRGLSGQDVANALAAQNLITPVGTQKIGIIGDQSLFVRGAITGVAYEGIIAALLTSVMILLFLGSWRSTIIIAVSIPLSVLGAIVMLSAIGETLNIMTLGGLALAVGILVDDATVTIENINWHLEHGKDVETSIMDGANQIVTPAFVSLLCICIVFVPMFFLQGVARFLFVPMAEAVMFAMIWSFLLSRTLVPTMAKYLLQPHLHLHHAEGEGPPSRNPLVRFQRGFEARFERVRGGYRDLLSMAMRQRPVFVIGFLVEESANQFADVQKAIRKVIPPDEIETLADNIGMPISGINMTYNNTGVIGPQDGDIQIKLKEGHRPTDEYVQVLREQLPRAFPGLTFAFLPADIVSQILNFGAPAPIDLQVRGADVTANFVYANKLLSRIRRIPGIADARIQQSPNNPSFNIDVDRTRAQYVGLTERDVTNSLVVNLAGSAQVAPTYYLNPDNGVSYSIVMQTPQYQIDSLSALETLPITAGSTATPPILGGIANITRSTSSAVVSQYDIQPMVQIYATPQGRDLGAVAADVKTVIADTAKDVPKGSSVVLLGQVQTMNSAFSGLLFGLLAAVVLIYLLIVVNFQSWSDPFVIITALPAALAGIVWMLFTTQTTLSVPALTGAIMCMGVATANSVLVISFARERYEELGDPIAAAIEAGFVRFRPVLMTALAMIIGMAPMALGLGEGGEQNAPLGRAVVGGLIFATVATLMFVPVVFSMVHKKQGAKAAASSETSYAH